MESLIIDWLNENESRAYPLKEIADRTSGGFTLADNVVVDALLFYTTPVTAELTSLTVGALTADFVVTGPQTFTVTLADPFPQYIRLANGSLLVVTDEILDVPIGVYSFSNNFFEDSVVFEFNDEWRGLDSLAFKTDVMTGDITMVEGIQFKIGIDGQTLTLGNGSTFGTPLDCASYSGLTNDCADIISFINGVGADGSSKITFAPGSSVVVLDDPDNNRIFIGLAFDANDVCKPIFSNPR